MKRLWLLAANDVRLTMRDRAAAFWLLAMPLAMMWLFGSIQFGGGQAPKVALTVIDRDRGWIARALIAELDGPGVELTVKDGAEAGDVEAAKATRRVVLPEGFTDAVSSGQQRVLRIEAGENASADYSRAAEVVVLRAITRTLARVVELAQRGPLAGGEGYAALAARPPLVQVASSNAGRGSAVPTGTAQSVPGILTFTVLMMTVIYGAVFLTIEKRGGMIRRQLMLPVSRRGLIAGKILGRVLIAAAQIAILLAAGRFLFVLDLGRSIPALIVMLGCYAFAVAGLATLLGAVLKNPEQASAVGWLTSMVMAAMGGCWWPSEVMPGWLRAAAHVFPTAWAMDAFHALISFGKGMEAIPVPCAVLVGFGAAFSWLGARYLE